MEWNSPGKDQADHFWDVISGLTNPPFSIDHSVIAVDVEENSSGSPSITIVNDFMNELSIRAWGDLSNQSNFMIYTNKKTWDTDMGNPTNWSDVALWLAAKDGVAFCPPSGYPFGGWVNWSYMFFGQTTLQGVTTDLDEGNF